MISGSSSGSVHPSGHAAAARPEEAYATTLCSKSYGFGFLSAASDSEYNPGHNPETPDPSQL